MARVKLHIRLISGLDQNLISLRAHIIFTRKINRPRRQNELKIAVATSRSRIIIKVIILK